VRHPKDKGKWNEMFDCREAGSHQLIQNPGATLAELNHLMKEWSLTSTARKNTAQLMRSRLLFFTERERPALSPFPTTRSSFAEWKQATVHPDHYIQYRRKTSPSRTPYLGKKSGSGIRAHIKGLFQRKN